ncbi:hypothetical protein LU631_18485 [Erwinia tracheiphila]|uniref:Type III effector n=1 Tax=Erwinia tracheiphila TaxID=65700 RepID=A0A0M2K897_9GAMM|nr:XopAH/AvrB family type III secretion system effector [Erwinia tracheiphila]AXF76430.1 type III effector [Erwinia tracheiphila]EOS96290.1 type III effector AvrB4-2 [Erwinia tracheiphila PSU-1]KKF35169.1 hypothetical protein SY86_06585 [Erwinia tracheiphila]UIA84909.1 hypothetical protein LU604_08455 [Erwinia tracheiphila]UIA86823.1 hypothetical protein LU631_18485 [Erwinia tracheiphila]
MGCVSSKQTSSVDSSQRYQQSVAEEYETSHTGQTSPRVPRYGELPGPSPSQQSLLNYYQQSLIGVARWPDPKYNNETFPQQQEYGRAFWHGTRNAGAEIAEGSINSFSQLWNRARQWRQSITEAHDYDLFGKQRYEGDVNKTPLKGRYEYLLERYKDRNDGEVSDYGDISFSDFTLREALNNREIELSRVSIGKNNTFYEGSSETKNLNFISHTNPIYHPAILDHVEELYKEAIKAERSDSDVLNILGETHWWLANAMLDERGSAAKAEFCVRAIAQARGMDLPPMKHGIVPDIEAMSTSRNEFVENYSSFFE